MTSMADEMKVSDSPGVIRIAEAELRGHLREMLWQSAEETLIAMLEAEPTPHAGRSGTSVPPSGSTHGPALAAEAVNLLPREHTLGAAAAEVAVRDPHLRMGPASALERRGNVRRDVLGRGVGASGSKHHRGLVRLAGEPQRGP